MVQREYNPDGIRTPSNEQVDEVADIIELQNAAVDTVRAVTGEIRLERDGSRTVKLFPPTTEALMEAGYAICAINDGGRVWLRPVSSEQREKVVEQTVTETVNKLDKF